MSGKDDMYCSAQPNGAAFHPPPVIVWRPEAADLVVTRRPLALYLRFP
jgi:hypothetical protein